MTAAPLLGARDGGGRLGRGQLALPASTPLGDLKSLALRQAGVPVDASEYLVKYLGAELQDEDRSLADAGVVPNATLVVLPRRRRPLR